jgi:SHS2 domain-containing protein
VYRWIDHTAELELRIEAATQPDLFADALAAFAELVGDGEGDRAHHDVSLEADTAEDLLAAWLDELVYLADVEGFVPDAAKLDLEGGRLRAGVHGRRGAARPLVKAVTRHGLTVEPDPRAGWRARVVLDV